MHQEKFFPVVLLVIDIDMCYDISSIETIFKIFFAIMTLAKIAIVVLVNFEMNKQLGRQLILIPYQSELTNPYLI